jgi:putative DNA primase/helicase
MSAAPGYVFDPDELDRLAGERTEAPDTDAAAAATETISAAITTLPDDPGAVLTDEAVAAWATVYGSSMAAYERLRASAKKAGARVAEVDRAIGARSKYTKERAGKKKTKLNSQSNTFNTSNTDAPSEAVSSYTDPFRSYTSDTEALPEAPGALLRETDHGPRLAIASDAALTVASVLRGRYSYCPMADMWHAFRDAHWEPLLQPAPLHEALTRWLYPATDGVGFTPRYQDSILTLIQRANMLALPQQPIGVIPFRNGMLDLTTRQLTPITPANATTWRLPYDYDPHGDCPRVKAWLLGAVGGDAETVELLRAFLSALIRGGAHLQRFLHLIGPGGSGKGTFFRLATALVGTCNTVSTDLKQLEQNRFEAATLYGKRLATIGDSDKYGGSINVLKGITGQDQIRLERKHVQQAGTFTFEGLVFMASNEALATTDYTSGLERRRVTVPFESRATEAEKAAWREAGGEDAVLHAELPGVVNWILGMSIAEMEHRISHPPAKTIEANHEAMRAGNPASDWLMQCCVPERGAWSQVGDKKQRRELDDGAVYFLDADTKLYPNYLDWCLRNGRESLSVRRFSTVVMDMAKTLGADVLLARRGPGQGIQGLRLKLPDEAPSAWCSHGSSVGSAGSSSTDVGSDRQQTRANAESVGCAGSASVFDFASPAAQKDRAEAF